MLAATEGHQGLIIIKWIKCRNTINARTKNSDKSEYPPRATQETDQSFLLGRPSFPPMRALNLSGSLPITFMKCHSLNQPIFFSRKCSPMALTLSFFVSLTFLGCKGEHLIPAPPPHSCKVRWMVISDRPNALQISPVICQNSPLYESCNEDLTGQVPRLWNCLQAAATESQPRYRD